MLRNKLIQQKMVEQKFSVMIRSYMNLVKQGDQCKLREFKYQIIYNICDKHPKKRHQYDIDSLELLLRNNQFFRGEKEQFMQMRYSVIKKGKVICKKQQIMNYFYVVLDGKVDMVDLVEVEEQNQHTVMIRDKIYEQRVVRSIRRGEYIGFHGTYYDVPEEF